MGGYMEDDEENFGMGGEWGMAFVYIHITI